MQTWTNHANYIIIICTNKTVFFQQNVRTRGRPMKIAVKSNFEAPTYILLRHQFSQHTQSLIPVMWNLLMLTINDSHMC